jgi:hypothetical protein
MNDLDDEIIKGAVGEVILGHLQVILEYLKDVPTRQELQNLAARFEPIETDIKIIKAVVTNQSGVLQNHEVRITRLEPALAD